MQRSSNDSRNSSLISIREPHLQNVLSNTNEYEKPQSPSLSIEALRTIGRIVRGIKARIDAANKHDEDSQICVSDSGSRAGIGAMGG